MEAANPRRLRTVGLQVPSSLEKENHEGKGSPPQWLQGLGKGGITLGTGGLGCQGGDSHHVMGPCHPILVLPTKGWALGAAASMRVPQVGTLP